MNQAYSRIRSYVDQLLKDKFTLEEQIKNMQKKDVKLKSNMHRIEIDILMQGRHGNASQDTNKLLREVKALKHDHHELHEDKNELKVVNSRLSKLNTLISTTKFWMKQANYDDPIKQAEAIKRVFG